MLDRLIDWSLQNRLLVVAASALLLVLGVVTARDAPVDVFPDLTAPTVTVMTEAPGLATEEVEQQVSYPIEMAMNGAQDVRRLRSQSVPGFSIVWVEFEWGTDILESRQIVTERLDQARDDLPRAAGVSQLGPITSIMGEIEFLGVKPTGESSLMLAREVADWTLAPRLLSIPGVANVTALGGDIREYQVLVSPDRLQEMQIGLDQVRDAASRANRNAGGGWISEGGQDYVLRYLGRTTDPNDIAEAVITVRDDAPVRIRHVAEVVEGPGIPIGDAGINGDPGVILAVSKQPGADTLELDQRIQAALDEVRPGLPAGIEVVPGLFRQADFINRAVDNVAVALRDGAIFVVVVLFAFLFSFRTTLISVLAIPLSLVVALIGLTWMGIGINTMTLGGMTIAIGALVDDAIIFVENIYRRLRENRHADQPAPAARVVYRACAEVRQSVVFSTAIIMLVFAPLFFLDGVEGRLLEPLGLAYLIAIAASLLVALTLTPVLSLGLLTSDRAMGEERDPPLIRFAKGLYRPVLNASLRFAPLVLGLSVVAVIVTLLVIGQFGRSFLPEFNEGSLTIKLTAPPGTSLETSAGIGRQVEEILLGFDEVESVARKTGRAALDAHTQGPNASELEVVLGELPQGKAAFLADLREALGSVSGVNINIGQPLSHRIDHMLSGTRAAIAVKIFGPSLGGLRDLGNQLETTMKEVDGLVDVAMEPLQAVPELRLRADRDAIARYGMTVAEVADLVETAYRGRVVSEVFEGNRRFDLVVRFPDEARDDRFAVGDTLIQTPIGDRVPLRALATPSFEQGPGTILREDTERRLVVSANVAGRDLRGAVEAIQARVAERMSLPEGYRIEYGGQFEAEAEATRTIGWVSLAVLAGILLLLQMAFRSLRLALLVMVNIPLALVGGVTAVWAMGGVITVAALVGFITLFGIAIRNGILLISRFQALARDGMDVDEAVVTGSMERLAPILMTALTAGLALIPLAMGLGEPGTEIQAPMAVVILGGLATSTLLNMVVLPALYRLVASRANAG
ncbi:efflux RND transporter permease subunit [Guyparkeria hydrothermalis]|uniref:efflux RND transporter permease subunit n=1 Tax=Guyparkeria hydrothermalis TaxID=923 RepID=UPI00202038F1|nr:efflux RND transporter permease subunit [Guyparkeria hydrothermalis]MCL7751388.1 efflux RND transporter permease subunit [Guyparkeria hydrothermalis]